MGSNASATAAQAKIWSRNLIEKSLKRKPPAGFYQNPAPTFLLRLRSRRRLVAGGLDLRGTKGRSSSRGTETECVIPGFAGCAAQRSGRILQETTTEES